MEKILTIVIPTYNMQDYLRRCLDSLIVPEEQMKQLEVLVVNDGSKDNSSAIAHEYQDKYPDTFRVIDKDNGNYGSCVNRGLKEATGKYIKILDADDWFDTEGVSKLIFNLVLIDVDVIITGFDIVDATGKITKKWKISCPSQKIMTLKDLVKYHPLGIVMHAICYRTDLLRDISYVQPEGISYTDQIWINEPLANAKSIIYLPVTVYKYFVGREGQTVDPNVSIKNIKHHIACALEMVKAIDRAPEGNIPREFLVRRAIHTIKAIYLMFLTNNLDAALLVSFDNDIKKSNANLYYSLNDVVLHPFVRLHYIKAWRQAPHFKFRKHEMMKVKLSSFLYKFFYRKRR